MVKITLPDGSVKEFENGVTPYDVAASISENLSKAALAAKINGTITDLRTKIEEDSNIELITDKSPESLEILRHTTAHILAQAVGRLFPKSKRTIGPATENGFFYDFDSSEINDETLPKIEAEMNKIIEENLKIEFEFKTKQEFLNFYKDNKYKQEIIEGIFNNKLAEDEMLEGEIEGGKLKFYKQGKYEDMCTGPHLPRTSMVKAFKLEKTTKAYWRGDSKNKQLTRIYGSAFWKKSQMDEYYKMVEEAKKRDHRILGANLNLFTVSPLVGSGLPLLKPNGMILRTEIENYLWELHKLKGYKKVWTPHIAKKALYETSGHAAKFGDELFKVKGKDEEFVMKPMNCPHHMQIFADNYYSYKDLPIRYFEPATVYRDELSGALSGLSRVRAITQDDGHLFCRIDQIKDEVTTICQIIDKFYKTFNMGDEYWVSLSVRDDDKSKYLGTDEVWQVAEKALEEAAKANRLNYKRIEGEAAFYGPKLDFMFKDCIGREVQLATIQCDFNLPERFELFYVDEKGEKQRPVVIHRAISGSIERFMSILIEHFAGKFPLWISPVQIKLLSIADRHIDDCEEIRKGLEKIGFRVETNYDRQTTSNKVRLAQEEKVNYIIVIGDKDIETKTLAVRDRNNKTTVYKMEEFIKMLTEERDNKIIKF